MGFCVPAIGVNESRADSRSGLDGSISSTSRSAAESDGLSGPVNLDVTVRERGCSRGRDPKRGEITINEILINVPSGSQGDANRDGRRDAFDDEFVELANRSSATLDLEGTRLLEGGDVKLKIGGRCMSPGASLLVFGGLSAQGTLDFDGDALVADSRLGFPNSGGTFSIQRSDGTELARVDWHDAPAESLTLDPQLDGSNYRPHSDLQPGTKLSPGRCANGSPLSTGCPATSPSSDAADTETPASKDAGASSKGDF